MIALWMLSSIAWGALVFIAAAALDAALQLDARQTRGIWVMAACTTVLWPLLAPWLLTPETTVSVTQAMRAVTAGTGALPADVPSFISWRSRLGRLDTPLLIAWTVGTLWLSIRWVLLARALRQHMRDAQPQRVDGQSALVTNDIGPAVIGVWRPRMVLPSWFFELDRELRALILSHESEHVRARDQMVLTAARVFTTIMPWNPLVWVLARRTRLSTEVDCDRRVLRGGVTPVQYAQLLMFVAHRQHNHPLFTASPAAATLGSHMAGSPTTLRRRITAMHLPVLSGRARNVRYIALGTTAIAALALGASPRLARALANVREARVLSPAPSATQPPARPMVEFQIDSQATLIAGTATPRYPDALLATRTNGSGQAQFVVDSSGLVIRETLKIVGASHPAIGESIARAATSARFKPAHVGGRAVKQLVRLVYHFDVPGMTAAPVNVSSEDIRTFEITVTAPR